MDAGNMVETHQIIDIAFACAAIFIGWTIKRLFHSIDELWRKHDEMTSRLTKIAIELPKEYVTKTDLSHAITVIHERFDKLEDKIDSISFSK